MRRFALLLGFLAILAVPEGVRAYREGFTEWLVVRPDAKRSVPHTVFEKKMLRELALPATYDIIEGEEGEDEYCRRFVTDQVAIVQSQKTKRGVPREFTVTLRGEGADYCEVVDPDVDYETVCSRPAEGIGCQCSTQPDGKLQCRSLRLPDFSLTLRKSGGWVSVEGSESPTIRIAREPLARLPFEWGGDEFYDYTRVSTQGRRSTISFPDGTTATLYTTPWKNIFQDLRGIGAFLFQERSGSNIVRHLTLYPRHNRSAFFFPFDATSCEECLARGITPFCIKQEGKNLLIASRSKAVGTQLTLWIDEHFKR